MRTEIETDFAFFTSCCLGKYNFISKWGFSCEKLKNVEVEERSLGCPRSSSMKRSSQADVFHQEPENPGVWTVTLSALFMPVLWITLGSYFSVVYMLESNLLQRCAQLICVLAFLGVQLTGCSMMALSSAQNYLVPVRVSLQHYFFFLFPLTLSHKY